MRRSTRMMMTRGDRPSSRSRDTQGRERYDNGRYAPSNRGGRGMSNRGDNGPSNYYPDYPEYRSGRMNRIGYEMDDGDDNEPIEFPGAYYSDEDSLTEKEAMEWVKEMENEDGSRGPHWSFDQVQKLMKQKDVDEDPMDMYVAVNMMYSDYCKVARELNVNNSEFYVKMAKAFLDDKDAGTDDKLSAYYFAVVCGE